MRYVKKYKPALWKRIKSGSSGHALPIRRKSIKPRTSKRAKQERQYRQRAHVWKMENPLCKGVLVNEKCEKWTQEIHHSAGRAGKLLNFEPLWVPLCKNCHDKAHHEPKWARDNGLLCEKGQWNNQKAVDTYLLSHVNELEYQGK